MARDSRITTSGEISQEGSKKESSREALSQLQAKENQSKLLLRQLSKFEQDLNKEVVRNKLNLYLEAEEEVHRKRMDDAKKEGNELKYWWESSFGTWAQTTRTLTTTIDKALNDYLQKQQSLAAHLSGSSSSLEGILNNLQSSLSTSNIVKQQDVFNNLNTLVKSGITYNVEQRAFLQTLANDIDMVFNAQDGSLTQLIRLQNRDLSSNRVAIEYSLQKFLNQNYQTSEYIHHGFQEVSSSLLAAQSTMSADSALAFEAIVQAQLGQMYSAGFNETTVTGIAKAINDLGSGQIPTGGGLSNLVLMAAARAGLDYGTLLNNGLTAESANTILTNIAGYLNEMGANQSNIVKSQLGSLFGVTITDIMAAQNMREVSGSVTTNASGFLGDYSSFVNFGQQLKNSIANVMYSFGTNMASNSTLLMSYEISKIISDLGIGNMLYGYGESLEKVPFISEALKVAGVAANYAPLFPIMASILGIGSGGAGSLSDILTSLNYTKGGAADVFNSLGQALSGATIEISGAGVSGSIYMSTGGSDILNGSTNSLKEIASSVTSIESDKPTEEDNVELIATNVVAIFNLLDVFTKNIGDRWAASDEHSAGGTAPESIYNRQYANGL